MHNIEKKIKILSMVVFGIDIVVLLIIGLCILLHLNNGVVLWFALVISIRNIILARIMYGFGERIGKVSNSVENTKK